MKEEKEEEDQFERSDDEFERKSTMRMSLKDEEEKRGLKEEENGFIR